MTTNGGHRRIVDAHHHLWDLSACDYPWLLAKGVPRFFGDPAPIRRDYLIRDFQEEAADFNLVASVHVQVGVAPGQELRETSWLQRTADKHGLPSAIVAYCDLAEPSAEGKLRAQLKHPRLRGIRQIIGRSDEEDARTGSGQLLCHDVWLENLAKLRDLGLSFDLQLVPGQMPKMAEILSGIPGLKVALCHCGSPWDQTPSGLRAWRAGLKMLAGLPDISCKLSGLGMFDHAWTVDSIRPLVESCIEAFGAHRCMIGSNFPVDKLYGPYTAIWRAYEQITTDLTPDEQEEIFVGTATSFYALTA